MLNAANEIAVELFLQDRIGFLEMSDLIEERLAKATFVPRPTMEDLVASDDETRRSARTWASPAWNS